MGAAEDDDIQLQRTSKYLFEHLKTSLPRLLWKHAGQDESQRRVHRWAHLRTIGRIVSYIEPFQEEPQLLDPHLKQVLPLLVNAYLEYLPVASSEASKAGYVTLQHAICRLLYLFCKVRGEKIVMGFLNNEPRYLEPILAAFERSSRPTSTSNEGVTELEATWEERYVLLLWLSHLMLAPFDLASISSSSSILQDLSPVPLPNSTPSIAAHIFPMCMKQLESPSKERDAAALLLVRLCVRPDMRKLGLLDTVVTWALSRSTAAIAQDAEVYQYLGILSFLNRLLASANTDEIGKFIPAMYQTCQTVTNNTEFAAIRSSAIVRKFIIKIYRSIICLCLQWESQSLDMTTMLEEVIEYLLGALADTDTPVRYAASKALSVILLKLDPEMAAEVVEAVLASFGEDNFWDGASRNLAAVDPLRWHGLTLTLGHVLYRRVPPTDQLPEIINVLLMALSFEQRSTTGASIGTNVRDAACFGIWSLSRRYKTDELAFVDTSNIRSLAQHDQHVGLTQMLAIELLVSACLDPAGNIRRGSSAALQELIGRHPDTVAEGIPLVQVIDYHAVSLRSKAIEQVAIEAAMLHPNYWRPLLDGALGWRGLRAVDSPSRESSGILVGKLAAMKPFDETKEIVSSLLKKLEKTRTREVEERHGLIVCLACVIGACHNAHIPEEHLLFLTHLWKTFREGLMFQKSHFTDTTLRPELNASAFISFVSELTAVERELIEKNVIAISSMPLDLVLEYLQLCMRRTDDSTLTKLRTVVGSMSSVLDGSTRVNIAESWLKILGTIPSAATRPAGLLLGLGTLLQYLSPAEATKLKVLNALASRCSLEYSVETRAGSIRSWKYSTYENLSAFSSSREINEDFNRHKRELIGTALSTGLNDYTVTERGDVGSLVRIEALNAVEKLWKAQDDPINLVGENQYGIHASVVRLSLERLDKVRKEAATALVYQPKQDDQPKIPIQDLENYSSYEYFRHALLSHSSASRAWYKTAVLEGYISTAGMGAESLLQISREALIDHIEESKSGTAVREISNDLLEVFGLHIGNDRIIIPLLEVIAFLFDVGVITDSRNTDFRWRRLLSLVQKAHFKSTVLQKLLLAVDVYRGLAEIDATRNDVLAKLCSMLLHPFPKVRVAVAETLLVVTEIGQLTKHDWSRDVKGLKAASAEVKHQVGIL